VRGTWSWAWKVPCFGGKK